MTRESEEKKIKEYIMTETGRKKGSSNMGNLLFNVQDPFNQSDHLMSLNEENGVMESFIASLVKNEAD